VRGLDLTRLEAVQVVRDAGLRRLVGVALYVAAGIGVMVAVWPAGGSAPRAVKPPPPVVARAIAFPAPPPGAVVVAREAGANLVALAVREVRGTGQIATQVSVVGREGSGVEGLRVRIAGAAAETCGLGCYRANVPAAARVPVEIGGLNAPFAWRASLPPDAHSAAAIVRRATLAWRGLVSVSWHEVLGSDSAHIVRSDWRAVAPNRVAYVIRDEGSAVVIGGRRWDRSSLRAPWRLSVQDPPLHQPAPFWVTARNARVLGTGTDRGHAVWFVSFYDPRTPGWFQVEIDKQSFRTLHMDMYATAHFMHDTYGAFGATRIVAPAT
jgi:hypothetical protein